MAAHRTTRKTGQAFTAKSRRVSKSTKTRKAPGRMFGTSSQFRGVGVGVAGDVRR